MARVVVIGGGFGGLAAAARLAKLGHEVSLLERSAHLGGALRALSHDGFTFDAAASYTLLPAVLRDLFRKSGRPLEAELDLVELDLIREHRFPGGDTLRLPGSSRAAQLEALGPDWVAHVGDYTSVWETLRTQLFEVLPADPLPREAAAVVEGRQMLAQRLKRSFRDERLRAIAAHPFTVDGHEPRDVPAWAGVVAYVEQRFGAWTIPGGMGRLAEALTSRVQTRKVAVHTSTTVRDLVVRGGRPVAVETDAGPVDADVVVVAIDPRHLPALGRAAGRTLPAVPPYVTHVGLDAAPDLPHEVVVHSKPEIVVRTRGTAVTTLVRGQLGEDVLTHLARHKIDLRERVVTRIDLSPRELVEQWGGSPLGVRWHGRSTTRHRMSPRTPIPDVYAVGAAAAHGPGLAFVGLTAAVAAQAIGPAR